MYRLSMYMQFLGGIIENILIKVGHVYRLNQAVFPALNKTSDPGDH